jgi:hypothetical protein
MIYFCIPTYNEERTVGVVLWKLRQVMSELQRDYQIIVVDDASTDSTAAVLSPYIRVLPLTVIRNAQRRGYADSLESALRETLHRSPYPKRDAVVTMQADFTEDPDALTAMIKKFEAGADVVTTTAQSEASASRWTRLSRSMLRWVIRRSEADLVGNPLSGFRAYRVVTLKRALEARAGKRLLTWPGTGANVELLIETLPHSRRHEVVETTLLQHRMQRASRFSFFPTWQSVRGAARGRIGNAAALATDSVVAQPQPIAVEARRERPTSQRPARGRGPRPERSPRPQRPQRPRSEPRAPRPTAQTQTAQPVQPAQPVQLEPAAPGEPQRKKRRRRRGSRKKPQTSETPQLVAETTVAETAVAPEAQPQPTSDVPKKKKSRRGRRGGRGRRRGPKPGETNNTETPSTNGGEPPSAAEG